MKKNRMITVAAGTLLLGSLSLAGADCLSDLGKSGLTVGTSPDYPPYESLDKKNQIVGFDIDLIKLVAAKMKLPVKVVGQSFDGLIPSLLTRKIDVVAAGMTITPERLKAVGFTDTYIAGDNVILVRKENAALNSLAALKGKRVAVQIGSAQEKLVSDAKTITVKAYNLYTDAVLAVQTRQADGVVLEKTAAQAFQKSYPDLRIVATLNALPLGFAVRKNCTDLAAGMNTSLAGIKKSGEMQKLVQKWFK